MKKLLVLILLIVGMFYTSSSKKVVSKNTPKTIIVYVEGAIKKEGRVEIHSSNMSELLEQVELDENADLSCVSYDRLLLHNDLVYIPFKGDKVSLNQASKEELMRVKGIGEAKADLIIENRPYDSIEQIMEIPGIGEKTYYKWREYLCL